MIPKDQVVVVLGLVGRRVLDTDVSMVHVRRQGNTTLQKDHPEFV